LALKGLTESNFPTPFFFYLRTFSPLTLHLLVKGEGLTGPYEEIKWNNIVLWDHFFIRDLPPKPDRRISILLSGFFNGVDFFWK